LGREGKTKIKPGKGKGFPVSKMTGKGKGRESIVTGKGREGNRKFI